MSQKATDQSRMAAGRSKAKKKAEIIPPKEYEVAEKILAGLNRVHRRAFEHKSV